MFLLRWAVLWSAAALFAGCTKPASTIATYPVTGTVIYQGKPLAGATVTYVSKNPDDPAPNGVTDPEGHFSLATYFGPKQILKGAPAGDYRVIIAKQSAADVGKPVDFDHLSDDEKKKRMQEAMKMPIGNGDPTDFKGPEKPKLEVPEKYTKTDTSGLVATVVSGVNDPAEFKLSDD
jgi:hypothetical protein